MKTHEDLDGVSKDQFFRKTEFYSSLRNEIISDDDYENVKKFWKTMRLKKLSKLNDIYNFQDTIILCQIFENRAITAITLSNFIIFIKIKKTGYLINF